MDGIYKHVSRWDTEEVTRWMSGLHKCLEVHIPQFLAHCICGSDLLKMSHQQLEYLKVTQVGHQELLLEAVELLSALENSLTHDFTLTLASNLSKKTSQLINALNPPSSRKRQMKENSESNGILSRVETTAGVMMAAKLLLGWLDRNPSSFVENYESFRAEVLMSALELASILQDDYDVTEMLDTCRVILKYTAVMMCPQNFSSMEPIELVSVQLQPREDSGLGFSLQRTRQGNLVVNHVIPGSPASESGKIAIGIEVIQINDQNVVGWEMSKVIETLKASGHQVMLVINAGHSKNDIDTVEQVIEDNELSGSGEHLGLSQEESCDSYSSSNHITEELLMNTSHLSDDRSSTQDTLDTLDDIAESPASFEGDTDFSGMENILLKNTVSLDIHRTSSAPLIHREKGVVLEGSIESGSFSLDHPETDSLGEGVETRSLDALDDGGSTGSETYVTRLQMRTSSDGTVDNPKNSAKKKSSKRQLPPVAYRTQVIGGVVVRVPIKEDQEKSNHKRNRGSRHKNRVRKNIGGAGSGSFEDVSESKGSIGRGAEDQLPTEGDDNSDKGRAVFSECKEVMIGGQTTRQVTVSSNTEIIGGKKSSNPALMVPCFQLKNAEKEGFLCKLGGSGLTPKNWRRRWFVLKEKKLYYYKTAFDITALGIVDMVGYTTEQSPESKKKFVFKASRQGARTYYFNAETAEDMMSWIDSLMLAAEPDDRSDLTESRTIEASDDEL